MTYLRGLRQWYHAALRSSSRPATILVQGDSNSEGLGPSDVRQRWQTVLQSALRAGSQGAQFPFIPAWPAGGQQWPVVRAGSGVVASSAYGLGWRTAVLQDATASLTFTFTGDRCALMFVKGPVTGVVAISIDGGPAVVVDTNASAGSTHAARWDSPVLSPGLHTVVVTRDPSSAAGQYPYVQGLLTWNGDHDAGVRVLDGAHTGYASRQLTTGVSGRINTAAVALETAGGADLAIISWGTNDTVDPATTPEQFRANIEASIAGLRARGFAGSVLLVNLYKGNGIPEEPYSSYAPQLAAIAAADPDNVAFLDLRGPMPDVPNPYNAPEGMGYFADNLHMTAAGHARVAELIATVLDPGHRSGAWLWAPSVPGALAWVPMVMGYDAPRRAPITVHEVIGRPDPIVTLAPLSLRSGSLDVWCTDWDSAQDVVAVYETGAPVMFSQVDYSGMDLYHVVSEVRPAVYDAFTRPRRWHVSVDFVELATPVEWVST